VVLLHGGRGIEHGVVDQAVVAIKGKHKNDHKSPDRIKYNGEFIAYSKICAMLHLTVSIFFRKGITKKLPRYAPKVT
jgi:hypothetical protein